MSQPQPWYRKFNDTWYVQVGSRQIALAKGKKNRREAFQKFIELLAQQDITAVDDESRLNVASVCDAFLDWVQKHQAHSTYLWYRGYLQDFCNNHGRLKVLQLKPFHVTRWLDEHVWSQSSRRCAITTIKRALNWAVEEGYLTNNPLRSFKRPASGNRTQLITDEQHAAMFDASDEHFQLFLIALRETGARPGEISAVTAADVDLDQGIWVLKMHKTVKKTGKPRSSC